MPTITLYPGTVSGIPGTGLGSVVGSGSVWHDASDSTYLDSQGNVSTGEYTARAPLDTLTLPAGATVTSVVANIRVQALSTSATPARVGAVIRDSTHTNDYAIGDDLGTGHTGGWTVPSTGSILDLSLTIDQAMIDFNGPPGATVADLVTQLEAAGVDLDIRALNLPTGTVRIRVYEFSVDVNYDAAIDLPCDTWVDLDLADAVFTGQGGPGGPFGQYGDGVIYSANFPGYPDFFFPGLDLDPTKRYRVEITFDPGSGHDSGGRLFSLSGVIPGQEDDPNLPPFFPVGDLYDGSSNTADVATATIGPGINGWDDPDFGVTAGYVRLWFETDRDGAVSAIRVRKVCTVSIPPLRLTNRADRHASAPSLTRPNTSRQGGNRLTGYL